MKKSNKSLSTLRVNSNIIHDLKLYVNEDREKIVLTKVNSETNTINTNIRKKMFKKIRFTK